MGKLALLDDGEPPKGDSLLSLPNYPAVAAREIRLLLGALFLECILAAAAIWLPVGVGWLLIGHFCVVIGLFSPLRVRAARGLDTTQALLALIATFVAGPIGTVGALVAIPFLARPVVASPLLAAWYERIALSSKVEPSSRLADNAASGRTVGIGGPLPVSFESVITRGTLGEQQTALGLIARNFHPAYGPALQAALKSPEAVVRVQAAAVAARVRGQLKLRIRELMSAVPDPIADQEAAWAAAATISEYLGTGLLDDGDRLRAGVVRDRLIATLSANLDGRLPPSKPRSPEAARLVEAELLKSGRLTQFRVARKIHALMGKGRYKLRRVKRRPRRAHSTQSEV